MTTEIRPLQLQWTIQDEPEDEVPPGFERRAASRPVRDHARPELLTTPKTRVPKPIPQELESRGPRRPPQQTPPANESGSGIGCGIPILVVCLLCAWLNHIVYPTHSPSHAPTKPAVVSTNTGRKGS